MMETQQLEKQFEIWKRFLFLMIGSSMTFVAVALGNIVYGTDWPGFGNYVGGIWTSIQFLSTLPGFYLLWGRQWKLISLSSRLNTIFGYFAASWLSLLSLGLIMSMPPAMDYYILLAGSAIVMIGGYSWALKRTSISREEMFP
jgi:hypothetical protein